MSNSKFVCASSLVIFGGTGDLTRNKLIPALCRLKAGKSLPENFHVIATGRNKISQTELINLYRDSIAGKLQSDSVLANGFELLMPQIHYIHIDPSEDNSISEFMQTLKSLEGSGAAPARLFYLALPPDSVSSFLQLVAAPLKLGSCSNCPSRILVEKPFGNDLESAQLLNRQLLEVAREDQIYRIDHYLGKEAIQNILVLRFANSIFEPLWNRSNIDHIQISCAERKGVGTRGAFYDRTGTLRDVVQNHLLQVLSLIAMEPPISHNSENIRIEKQKVLKSLRKLDPESISKYTIRGRYTTAENSHEPSYLQEKGVATGSTTETFASMKVMIDSWRWSGVPFYLRAGKKLSADMTEVAVFFKQPPGNIFRAESDKNLSNTLTLRIQPDEGIHLSVQTKVPGMSLKISTEDMDLSFQKSFGLFRPDAYERLLVDALNGDQSLFIGKNEIDAAWQFIDPIRQAWDSEANFPIFDYIPGSDGPEMAQEMLKQDGRTWKSLSKKHL
ncbi:MAG: glucose-6-phosphate dehydrogenase [Candidatus Riflebacteria bacterium]|nr:glucose-6-phosphate dehydrogenase [Candidatus Riflebacteria bacterium]